MIRLSNDWVINADDTGYTLAREYETTRTNKDTRQLETVKAYRDPTYHRTLEQAGTAYLRRSQHELIASSEFTAQEAATALKRLTEAIQQEFKEVIERRT